MVYSEGKINTSKKDINCFINAINDNHFLKIQ